MRITKAVLSGMLVCFLAIVCSGAGDVTQMKVVSGDNQCAMPGETFQRPLRIEVFGTCGDGFFSSDKPPALAGVKLKIEPLFGSDLKVSCLSPETDIAGCMVLEVTAGKKLGDHYLRISPESQPAPSITVRLLVGAKVDGAEQEAIVGAHLSKPISIKIVDPNGQPIPDVPVYFTLKSAPESDGAGCILQAESLTNKNGEASTTVQIGDKTGEYQISVEAADSDKGIYMRPIPVRALGIDIFQVTMNVLIGLTFLILGMIRLSNGLQQVAGENMKKFLAFFSKNRIIAIIAGTLVTAFVQSSSATTVMVLGFINAGLLSLQQAIGIIFGANIGTTITAQLIAFNLNAIAFPAIVIGFCVMFMKKRVIKGWGEALFGFGMLFFGMTMMSTELKLLSNFPSFIRIFSMIDCAPTTIGGFMPIGPVLGAILIGTAAACAVQASAAIIGIILALAASGLINFYTAVPLLIGTNIGTTITAWLASIAANREAKQAAMAHMLFNVFGTLVMLGLFYVPCGKNRIPIFLYIVNAMTPGDAFAPIPQNLERHIAMAHTMFNVTTVLILLPFAGTMAKFCAWLIPIRSDVPEVPRTLEPLLLKTPSLAITQSISEVRRMVGKAWGMVQTISNGYFLKGKYDKSSFDQFNEEGKNIASIQNAITDYLVQITRQQLTNEQSKVIPVLMHATNDAECIADHVDSIMRLTKRQTKTKKQLSDIAKQDLQALMNRLNRWALRIESELAEPRQQLEPFNIEPETQAFNRQIKEIERRHIELRNDGKCPIDLNIIYLEMLWELKRVGDHLISILEKTPEIRLSLCKRWPINEEESDFVPKGVSQAPRKLD